MGTLDVAVATIPTATSVTSVTSFCGSWKALHPSNDLSQEGSYAHIVIAILAG
jgi:hypothetical protein